MVIDVSKSRAVLTTHNIAKALRSKEAVGVVDIKSWPTVVEVDDAPKKKLTNPYRAPTPEMIAYLDFSVSTTGMLSGVKVSVKKMHPFMVFELLLLTVLPKTSSFQWSRPGVSCRDSKVRTTLYSIINSTT